MGRRKNAIRFRALLDQRWAEMESAVATAEVDVIRGLSRLLVSKKGLARPHNLEKLNDDAATAVCLLADLALDEIMLRLARRLEGESGVAG